MDANSKPLIAIDVESSGLSPFHHEVLAVALVPLEEGLPPVEVYVRPENEIKWSATAKNYFKKYEAQWEAHSVPPRDACDQIEEYLARTFPGKKVTPVGQNVALDWAFLRKLASLGNREELAGIHHRALDTHTMLYVLSLMGKIPPSALSSDGAFSLFQIEPAEKARHTAIGDALATRELTLRLLKLF